MWVRSAEAGIGGLCRPTPVACSACQVESSSQHPIRVRANASRPCSTRCWRSTLPRALAQTLRRSQQRWPKRALTVSSKGDAAGGVSVYLTESSPRRAMIAPSVQLRKRR